MSNVFLFVGSGSLSGLITKLGITLGCVLLTVVFIIVPVLCVVVRKVKKEKGTFTAEL